MDAKLFLLVKIRTYPNINHCMWHEDVVWVVLIAFWCLYSCENVLHQECGC